MWHPFTELHRGEFLKTTKILKAQQTDRDILQERKFMELALVLDHTMVRFIDGEKMEYKSKYIS